MYSSIRSIALLGRSPHTREEHRTSTAQQLWGSAMSYRDTEKRFDRIYEIHPLWMLSDPNYNARHWQALQDGLPADNVVMLEPGDDIPSATQYPYAAALALCGKVKRGKRPNKFITSTLDYMLAAAIMEKPDRIELYGFDLLHEEEWSEQQPGASFWSGLAAGIGIEIQIPETCGLMRAQVYAQEGNKMISRHMLRNRLVEQKNRESDARRLTNYWNGQMSAFSEEHQRTQDPAAKEKAMAAYREREKHRNEMIFAGGAVNEIEFQILHVDMREPEDKNKFFALPYVEKPVEKAVQNGGD